MEIQHFFDPRTWSLTYVVSKGDVAVVIDPVLDYDPKSGKTFTESADKVAAYLEERSLSLRFALDTHPHADHLTALPYFREKFGAETVIGSGIKKVQATWRDIFNIGADFPVDGRQFDILLEDGQILDAGPFQIEAFLTEGHTPSSLTYKIEDAVFVGDLLFMPDAGTARCDFPGGSSGQMFDAVKRLYQLPDETRVFTLHDYQPGGRELRFESSIAEEKRSNIHINQETRREDFIKRRKELEAGKPMPTLLFPSVQVNIRGGHLPEPEDNGTAYLKIPLNLF